MGFYYTLAFLALWGFFATASDNSERPSAATWSSLIKEQPQARNVLAYCGAINRSSKDCAKDFLGVGLSLDGESLQVTSSVSRLAAATCLQRIQPGQDRWQEIMNMFGVDASRLRMYSEGTQSAKFPGANSWSDKSREVAREKAFKEAKAERQKIRIIERKLDKHGPKEEKTARFLANVAEKIVDGMHASDEGEKAAKDPGRAGVEKDLKCSGNLCTNEHGSETDTHGNEIPPLELSGQPKPPPSGNFEQPVGTFDPMLPETQDFDPTAAPPPEPNVATPFLDDQVTKTSLEKCQDEMERKLWKQVGSKTTDPDAESPEDQKLTAEENLKRGVCDTSFFGREFCQDFKQKQWKVPLPPDQLQSVEEAIARNTPCAINFVEMSECRRASEEIKMRFVVHEDLEPGVNKLFQPKAGFPLLPRILDKGIHEAILAELAAGSEATKPPNRRPQVIEAEPPSLGTNLFTLERPARHGTGDLKGTPPRVHVPSDPGRIPLPRDFSDVGSRDTPVRGHGARRHDEI